ncbi:MAG: iron ABC transporter permease [Candidatus Methanomethylophilaceae archaeon]|nr:iron ABC transporter permease [Candidatus Methanomethylophilaceae archaeon]
MEYIETDNGYSIVEEYNASISRKFVFMGVLVVALFLVVCVACTIGSRSIDVLSIPGILWNHILGVTYPAGSVGWWDDYIVWDVRLPRILGAMVAGASLAICGAAVQSLMNNPIADPYTMGISSGACFGAVLAIIVGFSFGNTVGTFGITLNAFIFGMIPVAVVLMLSRVMRMSPVTLILVGVAISQFFGSITTLVSVGADEETLQGAYLWQVGSLNNFVWDDLTLMTILLVMGSIALYVVSWKFNVISLGDDNAKALGVDAEKFRLISMAVLAVMTMSVVAYTGIIGFVGIIAPHVVRYVIGSDNKFVIPASILAGALLLLCADTVSRLFIAESIPVGAMMAFIGGPVFIYLVIRKNSMFKGAY